MENLVKVRALRWLTESAKGAIRTGEDGTPVRSPPVDRARTATSSRPALNSAQGPGGIVSTWIEASTLGIVPYFTEGLSSALRSPKAYWIPARRCSSMGVIA